MIVHETKWIVIERKADGTEDCDSVEFDTPTDAHKRMSDLIKDANDNHTGSSYYVTSVVWKYRVAD